MENYQVDFTNYCLIPSTFPLMDNSYMVFQQLSYQISKQNQEITDLKRENEELKTQLKNFLKENNSQRVSGSDVPASQAQKPVENKKKPIRTFYCDYDNCDRVYASTLALNLHIKTKHNGGTKKQRDAYAKLIVVAELNGQPIPQFKFNFPSNYVQNYKKKFLEQLSNKKEHQQDNIEISEQKEYQF